MAGTEKRSHTGAAKRHAADGGTAVEMETEIVAKRGLSADLEEKVRHETTELLRALEAKERHVREIRAELDTFDAADRAPVAWPPTVPSIDPNVQIDVYKELLARTEAAHTRLEYLRITLENLDRKVDASFAGLYEALGAGEAARRGRLSNKIDGFFGRNARALIALAVAATLLLLWNLLARV